MFGGRVVRRVLVNEGKSDGAPTAANIINALGILAAPSERHGGRVPGGSRHQRRAELPLRPNRRRLRDGTIQPASVVPWYAIEEAIDSAKGRRLLFIDTCHAAGAYNERLGNAAYYANILAYSSARWDQEALESRAFKHGLFTQALVEGLRMARRTAPRAGVWTPSS